jgi:hypothetical protein
MVMLKVRRIGPLVRALLLGAVAPGTVALAATTVAGCADENAPETHVKRLGDAVQRTRSVERLIQMYNDKMTTDKRDRNGEHVKPLLETIVQPLADLAAKGDLDQKTQGNLLSMLADTRDKRAIPALVKALDGYKPDDKRPDEFDSKMNDVVRNLGEMKAAEASDALLKLFQNMHFSWAKAQDKTFSRTIQDAMVAISDKKWEDALIKMLEAPIKTRNAKALADLNAAKDQMYWQTVSCLLLGNMKSTKAVPALMKVVITPFKGEAGGTAMSALIKIGKPASDAVAKLLAGEDEALKKYAEEEFMRAAEDKGDLNDKTKAKITADSKKAYQDNATFMMANIGSKEGIPVLLGAIEKGDETSDVLIATKLSMLPADPKVTEAFEKVWKATKLNTNIPPSGDNARMALVEAAGGFLDQALAQRIAQSALDEKVTPDDAETITDIQDSSLVLMMKVGGPAQLDLIDKLAEKTRGEGAQKSKLGKQYEKELKIVRDSIKECGDKGECWLKKLESDDAQKGSGFMGIKCAYMSAIYGGDTARQKLIAARMSGQLTNPGVAFVTETMIDRLSPNGDKEGADKLQTVIDKAIAAKEEGPVSNLKTVVNRMRARAM